MLHHRSGSNSNVIFANLCESIKKKVLFFFCKNELAIVLQHDCAGPLCASVMNALIGNMLKCVTDFIPVDYRYMSSLDFDPQD